MIAIDYFRTGHFFEPGIDYVIKKWGISPKIWAGLDRGIKKEMGSKTLGVFDRLGSNPEFLNSPSVAVMLYRPKPNSSAKSNQKRPKCTEIKILDCWVRFGTTTELEQNSSKIFPAFLIYFCSQLN